MLKEHIENHPEFQVVIECKRNVKTEYKSLIAKRYRLKQQLSGIMKDIEDVTVQTNRFEESNDTKDIVLAIRSEIINSMLNKGGRGMDENYNILDFGFEPKTEIEKELLADKLTGENGAQAAAAFERVQIGIDKIIREVARERRKAGLFL